MEQPDVRAEEARPDPGATEIRGPREVGRPIVAAVKGTGCRLPAGAGAETRTEAPCAEDQAQASEV